MLWIALKIASNLSGASVLLSRWMVPRIKLFLCRLYLARIFDFSSATLAKYRLLSYMISPQWKTPGWSAVNGCSAWMLNPSFTKLFNPAFVGVNSIVLVWSQTIRLISSGILLLNERSPASICAMGIFSLDAATAPASVEFVSPYKITKSGFSFTRISSSFSIIKAVCLAWFCEPTLRL